MLLPDLFKMVAYLSTIKISRVIGKAANGGELKIDSKAKVHK
jgi:hypothetical protein